MSLFKRAKDIHKANKNADKNISKDPEKAIDDYLYHLRGDLMDIRKSADLAIKEEKEARQELDKCDREIRELQVYAKRAVQAGNDGDARRFLSEKKRFSDRRAGLEQNYNAAAARAEKLRKLHDQMVDKIRELTDKRDALKVTQASAEAQQMINDMTEGSEKDARSAQAGFETLQEEADRELTEADARKDLARSVMDSSIDSLAKKYDTASDLSIDDELEALKSGTHKY